MIAYIFLSEALSFPVHWECTLSYPYFLKALEGLATACIFLHRGYRCSSGFGQEVEAMYLHCQISL
jgi:hypothetical protein